MESPLDRSQLFSETHLDTFWSQFRDNLHAVYHENVLAAEPTEILYKIVYGWLRISHISVLIKGPMDDRVIIVRDTFNNRNNRAVLIALSSPIDNHQFLKKFQEINIIRSKEYVALTIISKHTCFLLTHPKVYLVSLCHPDIFPLPRFALAISDLASALRNSYFGQIKLLDMQLGFNADDIVSLIYEKRPDIIGFSVTFGQQDILEDIYIRIKNIPNYWPLLVAGGSLPALNFSELVKKHPRLIIALGHGETTICDIVEFWHGLRNLNDVDNICFSKNFSLNPTVSDKDIHKLKLIPQPALNDTCGVAQILMTSARHEYKEITLPPELDLLQNTINHKGVMQLEISRGCPFTCSFCPRKHKGKWSAGEISILRRILPYMTALYKHYPNIAKKIYLIDEEFIGYQNNSIERVEEMSKIFKQYGFRFEAMARIDQVYKAKHSHNWLAERARLWRKLCINGLDRILFGVESGVDTVLKRFKKHITSYEIVHGIRLLSLLGVPLRLTYMTFDPLMNMDELIATYKFQGRTDLLLKKNSSFSDFQLAEFIHDQEFVYQYTTGKPIYTEIPYMLVSMECLLGSSYTAELELLGLAQDTCMTMARRNVQYKDRRIGIMSYLSQLWIDRNFALDYALKSVMKLCTSDNRAIVSYIREALKDGAYSLLGNMLFVVTHDISLLPNKLTLHKVVLEQLADKWITNETQQESLLMHLMDLQFEALVSTFKERLNKLEQNIENINGYEVFLHELRRWEKRQDWRLINE